MCQTTTDAVETMEKQMIVKCKYDELVSPKKLIPHDKNRNQHPKEQIDRLAKLIEYQGIRAPIVVSKLSNKIVKGHGTLMALKQLKIKEVPVVYQDFDNEDQEYAFLQSDNAIASWAELDFSGINADIEILGPDFDLDMLGISNFSLEPTDKMVEEVNKGNENSEWVSMPDWKPGEKEIRLILYFKTEQDREKYVNEHNIEITKVMSGQWISRNT